MRRKIPLSDFIVCEYFDNYFTLASDPKVRWLFVVNTNEAVFARVISPVRYGIAKLLFMLSNRTFLRKPNQDYDYYLPSSGDCSV